jgi:hypothetical protein
MSPALAHLMGLVVDGAKLVALVLFISVLQLSALVPPLRRWLAHTYAAAAGSSSSKVVDRQADEGHITVQQRGQHYVNKSIDFDGQQNAGHLTRA